MTAYRDRCNPEPHVVVLGRVRLEFGPDGLLRDPDAYQLTAMTKTPAHCERFVEEVAPATAAPATLPPAELADTGAAGAEDDGSRKSAAAPRKRQGSDA